MKPGDLVTRGRLHGPGFKDEAADIRRGVRLETVQTYLRDMWEGRAVALPRDVAKYMAARLLPLVEGEIVGKAGRSSDPYAGQRVQAYIERDTRPISDAEKQMDARKRVAAQTGMKYDSAARAHQQYLKNGKPGARARANVTWIAEMNPDWWWDAGREEG